MGKKKRRKIRIKLSKEEKQKKRVSRRFKTDINTVFLNSGFIQIPTRGTNFKFIDRTIEIDNIFLYQNILIVCEDTEIRHDGIKEHLLKSAQVFELIKDNKDNFITCLENQFKKFRDTKQSCYANSDYIVISVYCSYNDIDEKYKARHPGIIFLDYHDLQYFLNLSKIIKISTRHELFKYLKLALGDIGITRAGEENISYDGFLLPESPSGYPKGYKIVTFLIEPITLLEQSYVLRKQGWRDEDCLYQRLLKAKKIEKMREYLIQAGRVFVNNIIVSLPRNTILFDHDGKQIRSADINKKTPVKIQVPKDIERFGIIDGQHRIYAYHESNDKYDEKIGNLRAKQHLLVTGIMYPEETKDDERTRFEAQLFLEINDRQTKARSDLKQSIEMLINPFSTIAISKRILTNLSKEGPLCGYLEIYFYETKKIKTASIVSYGLSHLVKFSNKDSLYNVWNHGEKTTLLEKKAKNILGEYITFCTSKINDFLIAFKTSVPPERWTLDGKSSRLLTTTTINGIINCMRKLCENKKIHSIPFYQERLKRLDIDFRPGHFKYKSSHWKELGEEIYKQCFET